MEKPEQTVVQLLARAQQDVKQRLESSPFGEAKREFALANTALEEAQMRYTRGRAIEEDVFKVADLDVPATLEAVRERVVEERALAQARYHEPS